jgi:GTPase SAR1 family protein
VPEVKKCCGSTPFILIGTKNDLRQDKVSLLRLDRIQNEKPILFEEGEKLAKRTSAVKYFECSAVTGVRLENGVKQILIFYCFTSYYQDGLKEVFREVIKIYKNPPPTKDSSCHIL